MAHLEQELQPRDTEQKQLVRAVRRGFALLLTLTLILGGIGLYQLNSVNASLSKIVSVNNNKIALATAMRDAIRLRAMAINKMRASNDYFQRGDELMKFYDYARMYRQARDQLIALGVDGREQTIIQKLTHQANITQPLVRHTAESLMENILPADFNRQFDEASRQQETLFGLLDQSIDLQKQYASHAVTAARLQFEYTVASLLVVLVVLLSIGVVIARVVVRYVGRKNKMLAMKNAELERARAKADEATRAKSEFLANMSHEIRNPLTTILGFSQTLADEELTSADHSRAITAINNSGRHLNAIINDVLDISKIEAGKLEVVSEMVSPLDIVKDTVCMIEKRALDKGLQLDIDYDLPLPRIIVSDPLRIKQILLNLCGNAVKFTDAGVITIGLSFNQQTNCMLFSVRDTGIGMSPEQVTKVFLPFQQAENSTSRFYGGTGLGLSISKQLAKWLGGNIECRSAVGVGTTFIVSIHAGEQPVLHWLHAPPAGADMRPTAARRDVAQQFYGNVLLAEDSADIRELIMMFLQKAGLEAVAVTNGAEALQEVAHRHFDLLLMDVQMPVMDGLTAIRQLRTKGVRTPIVALTANATPEDRRRCLNSGADNFLVKPVERSLFYNMLSQYLDSKQNPGSAAGDQPTTWEPPTHQLPNPLFPSIDPPVVEVCDIDEEMQHLIQGFVTGLPDTVDEITTYYRAKQWQDLLSTSHRLKGAGGAFGYPDLSEIGRNIVDMVNQNNHRELKELIERLKLRCRQIVRKAG